MVRSSSTTTITSSGDGICEHAADWEAIRANKHRCWGERIGRLGAAEGFRVAEELRRQMLQRDPGWPGAETREADLRCHASHWTRTGQEAG